MSPNLLTPQKLPNFSANDIRKTLLPTAPKDTLNLSTLW